MAASIALLAVMLPVRIVAWRMELALWRRLEQHDYRVCTQCGFTLSPAHDGHPCPECGVKVDLAAMQGAWRTFTADLENEQSS